jgi:hypothetical protein
MNQLISSLAFGFGALTFAASVAAFDVAPARLRAKSQLGTETLSIQAIPPGDLETVQVIFIHKEKTPTCSFEIQSIAKRISHTTSSDDYNMALPDGSYAKYAKFKAFESSVRSLEIDQSSKNLRYASIVVKPPASYDSRRCRVKDAEMEVLFFR